MDVEPRSGVVKCATCGEAWNIQESSFECSCGHEFSAGDVEDSLTDMLDYLRDLVYELRLVERARSNREDRSKESLRAFIMGVMEGIGRIVGTAVEAALRFFFSH